MSICLCSVIYRYIYTYRYIEGTTQYNACACITSMASHYYHGYTIRQLTNSDSTKAILNANKNIVWYSE